MKYIVYTDAAGSYEDNKVGCAFIILTNEHFVASNYYTIEGMSNPTFAETIAVGLASGYLVENVKLNPDDVVEFNIDCISTIEFCNKHAKKDREGNIPSSEMKVVVAVQLLRSLYNKCKVNLFKVKAHKAVLNPNSYVDRLSKLGVRI